MPPSPHRGCYIQIELQIRSRQATRQTRAAQVTWFTTRQKMSEERAEFA
jgi:hypothetical protein